MSQTEVQHFFEIYRDAFNRSDGAAVAELWHTPSSISHPGKSGGIANTAWVDAKDMRANHQALCELYAKRGPHAWRFEIREQFALGADQSFVNLHWHCASPRDEMLADFQTGYLLIRTPGGIRVAHVAQYEE